MSIAFLRDEYSLSKSIKFFVGLRSQKHFKSIHASIVKLGFIRLPVLLTGLIDLALKCGALEDASRLFNDMPQKDINAWSAIGHARRGRCEDSFSFFRGMLASATAPNWYSFSGALSACSGIGVEGLNYGKQIHAQVLKSVLLGPVDPIVYNRLLDMYSKCQCLVYAQRLFGSMVFKGLVAWNSMMTSDLYCGQLEGALELLMLMVPYGVRPDHFTYAICIAGCATLASIKEGASCMHQLSKVGLI